MKVLVTGGRGFLGRYVVEELAAAGHEVSSLARGASPELEALGVRCARADVADLAAVQAAARGCDGVVHAAAKTGIWGSAAEYERSNVLGTGNVVEACRREAVRRLVFTSSPSVCFDGRDQRRAGNELPYAERFLCAYPRTKAEAERIVLAANGREGLSTCALRPHLVFGPRDPHLVPRLVARARAGRLAVVGDGTNEVSLTFVANAARAHRLALERLEPAAPHAGRAYFVAQEEPVRLWDWIAELLSALSIGAPRRRVPLRAARAAGAVLEGLWAALRLAGEPPLTRFVALQLGTTHSYDLAPLRRDLGYREETSLREATRLLVQDLRGGVPAGLGPVACPPPVA